MAQKKKKRILRALLPLLAAALLCGACFGYLGTYYRADPAAVAAAADASVPWEKTPEGDYVLDPGGAAAGLIFYPGGKVQTEAYLPLLRAVAEQGVFCVLCDTPFRLAVFEPHAADAVRERFPEISRWFVGGHSLGGVMAAYELSKHPGAYDGLLLLGAYTTADLSGEAVRALSVYGSEDRVLNREKYEQNRGNLPADTREIVLDGGCHAGFGAYGAQKGDGVPTLTNEAQISQTAALISDWIK